MWRSRDCIPMWELSGCQGSGGLGLLCPWGAPRPPLCPSRTHMATTGAAASHLLASAAWARGREEPEGLEWGSGRGPWILSSPTQGHSPHRLCTTLARAVTTASPDTASPPPPAWHSGPEKSSLGSTFLPLPGTQDTLAPPFLVPQPTSLKHPHRSVCLLTEGKTQGLSLLLEPRAKLQRPVARMSLWKPTLFLVRPAPVYSLPGQTHPEPQLCSGHIAWPRWANGQGQVTQLGWQKQRGQ